MKYRILVVSILFLACLFGPKLIRSFLERPNIDPQVQAPVSLSSEKLMQVVNKWRVEQGLQSYVINDALCRIANDRVPDGLDFHKGLLSRYSSYPSVISENEIIGSKSEAQALYSWLGSPPHEKALKTNFKYSCIATKGDFAVQIFSNCSAGCP